MSQKGSLSVMIPAFNEERTLELIVNHVLEQPEVGEVIAVDDGSTDGTWAIMSRLADNDLRVRAFRLEANQGKGAALRRAVAEVRMPFALVQDADLEYDPRDYPTLLRPKAATRPCARTCGGGSTCRAGGSTSSRTSPPASSGSGTASMRCRSATTLAAERRARS